MELLAAPLRMDARKERRPAQSLPLLSCFSFQVPLSASLHVFE
ncbi:hypothetical protein CVCC1112_1533 [Paenarthrobacter nicotinovorans]|nr:hypothetical protein CVCC1112_1533 [Paenarthrobacter nicotinovorans]